MGLCGARAAQNRGQSLGQDLQIEPEGPFIHVLKIKPHPLVEADSAPAVDLPKAGNTGLDAETPPLPVFAESFVVAYRQRSGAYEAHLSLKHVEQLGQFIDAASSEELPDRSDAWVVPDLEDRSCNFVLFFQDRKSTRLNSS